MENTQRYALLPQVLLPWYKKNARALPWRKDTDPYHIWLSEIMLQQTRVETVRGYYTRFLATLPRIQDLAVAEEDQLLKLWEGLGYYTRVRNLQKAAQIIVRDYKGIFPSTYPEISALPGIGPYTAGAIASICFDLPMAAVDGNVLRVICRLTEDFSPIDLAKTKKTISRNLEAIYPREACGEFTQALMEVGAIICIPKNPHCQCCPAMDFCLAHKNHTETQLPARLPKQEKRFEKRTVFLLESDGKLALERKETPGLLEGLWQLPSESGHLTPNQALEYAQALNTNPLDLLQEIHRTHTFTHIRWDMVCYRIHCGHQTKRYIWATPTEVQKQYAIPTAFRIFLSNLDA